MSTLANSGGCVDWAGAGLLVVVVWTNKNAETPGGKELACEPLVEADVSDDDGSVVPEAGWVFEA